MRRVIVPLNGTAEAVLAIPHAQQLSGQDGELLLVLDTGPASGEPQLKADPTDKALRGRTLDIRSVAMRLQGVGANVRILDAPEATANDLDLVAREHGADMMVCTRPGLDRHGELAWGDTLRKALAQSHVPILLSPPEEVPTVDGPMPVRLMVPLDESGPAEAVLRVAEDLANEWSACLWLTQVQPVRTTVGEMARAWEHLRRIADGLECTTCVNVIAGRSVATMLIRAVHDRMITDVVLTSRRRTAGPHSALGSVAERLIARLNCRIVLVPPFTTPAGRSTGGAFVQP